MVKNGITFEKYFSLANVYLKVFKEVEKYLDSF